MSIKYSDPHIETLFARIMERIDAEAASGRGTASGSHVGPRDDQAAAPVGVSMPWAADLEQELIELAHRNAPAVAAYWSQTRLGRGVPDRAFRSGRLYWFEDQVPARTFRTSGTTAAHLRGEASYSPRGLELLHRTILARARRYVTAGLEAPVIVRLVPDERAAPDVIMAYGMGVIASALGDPRESVVALGSRGVDYEQLERSLERAVAADQPVVLIGGSFVFVNVCDHLEQLGRSWRLPAGSRMVDAGGFKGRSRELDVDSLRASVGRVFGIASECCVNLFGMTELASQLYDSADVAIGPMGERPKGSSALVRPRVYDPRTFEAIGSGTGLLEVADLCILDRPYTVLTGDVGIASPHGVAITGRAMRGQTRGCSLSLDALTRSPASAPREVA